MEKIIKINGDQYRITSDKNLSNLEMEQVLNQIKNSTCGSHNPTNIKSLTKTCPTTGKKVDDSIGMSLVVSGGTTPYKTIKFYKKAANDNDRVVQSGCTKTNVGAGTYTCSYTIVSGDTFPIDVSVEVIDANDQVCGETCTITQLAIPSCDFTVT